MSRAVRPCLACLLAVVLAAPPPALGQGVKKDGEPKASHRLRLAVRKPGEAGVSKASPVYGVEVYHDPAVGRLVYVTPAGALGVVSGKATPGADPAAPLHGFELKARPPAEASF